MTTGGPFHLRAQGLQCIRNDRVLFEDLDVSLSSGEMMQLIGPNGSGKTSLLRILAGLALSNEGTVNWNDIEIRDPEANYVNEISYVGHQNGIKAELSPRENLQFSAALYNTLDGASPEQALEAFGLYGYEDISVSRLSSGQRRRVALSRLLLTKAHLWLLDEPCTSVDDKGRALIARVIKDHLHNAGMVILVSHESLGITDLDIKEVRLTHA